MLFPINEQQPTQQPQPSDKQPTAVLMNRMGEIIQPSTQLERSLMECVAFEHSVGMSWFRRYKRVNTQFWFSVAANVVLLVVYWFALIN